MRRSSGRSRRRGSCVKACCAAPSTGRAAGTTSSSIPGSGPQAPPDQSAPPYDLGCLSYFERLRALSRDRRTLLCVGLDPDPDRIEGGAVGALRHCLEVVRQTEEHVCCFKPNSAFWEQYGPDGWKVLMELRDEAPATPFLFDAKRGDMDNTMRAYARAALGTLGMDAATVSPYLGADSLH